MSNIVLYPSNWLYNAGVVGFLRVLESGINDSKNINKMFSLDGKVCIDKEYFDKIKEENIDLPKCTNFLIKYIISKDEEFPEWKTKNNQNNRTDFELKFERAGNKLFASNTPYQNLVQIAEWKKFEFSSFYLEYFKQIFENSLTSGSMCNFCGNFHLVKPSSNSKLQNRLFKYNISHNSYLGPSIGKFPNAFWNLNDSINICPMCAYLLVHSHFSFIQTKNGEIFINAPSFKVMWYLNKFAENYISRNKNYKIRNILAQSYIEFAHKISMNLGMWSLMNVELIIKRYDRKTKQTKIDYYSLPYETTKLLINKEVSSYIVSTKEPYILESILDGRYEQLLKIQQKILKYIYQGKDAFDDNYLNRLENKSLYAIKRLSSILPDLYIKIKSIL